jgi:hypothetical protein
VAWWLTVHFWKATAFHNYALFDFRAGRWAWVSALFLVTIVAPLLLATSLPGLLVAEWISPLRITGVWTYVAASAVTAALTIGLRQSRPLRFLRGFLADVSVGDAPPPTATAPSD